MRAAVFAALMTMGFCPVAMAADAPLISLDTWGTSRGWEAVGVLELAGKGRCTGTLISPDTVLTAAHCLFDKETSKRIGAEQVLFRAGWRDGRAVAERHGTAAVVDDRYDFNSELTIERVAHDVALIKLSAPIPLTHADPYLPDSAVQPGETVSVVSYGRGRFDAPSQQRECEVTGAEGVVKVFTCAAVPGSSGSPIFALRGSRPRIVAVVSGISQTADGQVTFGMDIDQNVSRLKRQLLSETARFTAPIVPARRLTVGQGSSRVGGAKFLKP